MKKLTILALGCFLAACSEAPTAPEAADLELVTAAGATVEGDAWSYDDCWTWGDEYSCWAYDGRWHSVTTPSGNTNYFYREEGTSSYGHYHYWPVTWWHAGESAWDYDNKWHLKKGEPQVYSWTTQQEWTETTYYGDYDCSYTAVYRFANGKVTKDIYDYTCV